jgi:hypothetical protein
VSWCVPWSCQRNVGIRRDETRSGKIPGRDILPFVRLQSRSFCRYSRPTLAVPLLCPPSILYKWDSSYSEYGGSSELNTVSYPWSNNLHLELPLVCSSYHRLSLALTSWAELAVSYGLDADKFDRGRNMSIRWRVVHPWLFWKILVG